MPNCGLHLTPLRGAGAAGRSSALRADERARVEPTSGSRRFAPSNPRWNVTPSGRLRRPVLASLPPTTTEGTLTVPRRAAGPLRAG